MDRELAGHPVGIGIGSDAGEAELVGERVESLRLCSEDGTELLFDVRGSDGISIRSGSIPPASTLVIPAECVARETAIQYVYFDNPKAWGVPTFFEASLGVRNGGMEAGNGETPSGWHHGNEDDQHAALWVSENPHSGDKCLKTVVAEGAEPTWIATRQRNIHLIGGAKYRLTAWVKARDATGKVGWYIHVGNEEQPMMIESVPDALMGGPGTYDWKKVSWEFTAPVEANRASLGTVLRGTGIAWYDDVKLERLSETNLVASAGKVRDLPLECVGQQASWYRQDQSDEPAWQYRVPLQVVNASGESLTDPLMVVDLSPIKGRMRGRLNHDSLQLTYSGKPIPHCRAGNRLFFGDTIEPETVKTYYLYFSDDPDFEAAEQLGYGELLRGKHNLVKNPSFEHSDKLPEEWTGGAPGERPDDAEMSIVEAGRFGEQAVRLHLPAGSKPKWAGWHQSVPVEPNQHYLYAAWVKTSDVTDNVSIHAHYRNADGGLCESTQFAAAGPRLQGTTDWTMLSSMLEMPADIAAFHVHLTANVTGTIWHDGVLLAKAIRARVGTVEARMQPQLTEPTAWSTNAIVKVFRNDLPPPEPKTARLSAAGNEKEPLQVCIRGPKALDDVRVNVVSPKNANGESLDDITVNLVGYVPIDHKTDYYRSQSPTWHRRYPTSSGRCDGWSGMWPDPLLPHESFDLPAHCTQPVWITVSVPKDAASGDYTGKVVFSHDSGLVEFPFHVHVWDFTLPDENHVKAIYDLRMNDSQWDIPGQTQQETRRRFWRFMAQRRVSPHRIEPPPSFANEGGNVTVDFSEFDEAAAYYFDELNLPHAYTPWHFSCFGWGHPPRKMLGEAPYPGEYPYENADRGTLREEYKKVYQSALRQFWDHVTEKGWDDRIVLYISDEPWDHRKDYVIEQMKALCDMIHEVDPDIRIYSSTWHHQPQWNGYIDVWGFGHYGRVSTETINERQAAGDTVWWTTDGQMCTDTPFCAIERLLPHYCFKYDVPAYEFWGIDWLTHNPHEFGWHGYIHQSGEPGESHWVRYPNGDGFLAYPGGPVGHDGPLSSLRLEQAREGVEDYEYLHMLEARIQAAKRAGENVQHAKEVLARAMRLVERPSPMGRYSTKILPEPDKLLAVKQAVAKAIVKLQATVD
ncbi:MAG: glycoside hydrolase domain-containing protein [Planctomycetota bacterium]